MEVFKFNVISSEEFLKREGFRKAENNCHLCGGPLLFNYRQDPQFAVLQEESKCEVCATEKTPTQHRVN